MIDKMDMIHNEILLYIAYKEGMLPKSDYIEYLKSQLQTIKDCGLDKKTSGKEQE